MKTKLVLAFTALLLTLAPVSQAGWGHGSCGWGGGARYGWGGGYYGGPRFGWGGFFGPAIGVTFASPVAVYRPVYYATPALAYYTTRAVYRTGTSTSTLVQAQAQLSRLGYYRGLVDGSFGPLTSQAISLFQADNGLRVTGCLDSVTLSSLGS